MSTTRPRTGTDTRERILEAAAALFAKRGYHGTSTRDIAQEVGIRQPSLFHHFDSKQAIIAKLLDRDLGPALDRIRCFRATSAGPAARLYAYLLTDAAALIELPFDARGLYTDEVFLAEGLAEQKALRNELHEETSGLVKEGIDSGAFRNIDPRFAQQVVSAMMMDTQWHLGAGATIDRLRRPSQIADFVLLGLLSDPGQLDRVREEGVELATNEAAVC